MTKENTNENIQKTFRTHFGMVDGAWITASTDGEVYACEYGNHRVYSEDFVKWMEMNPAYVITIWDSRMVHYRIMRHNECVEVTPPNQGMPWYPQQEVTDLTDLPEWVVRALVDIGEVGIDPDTEQ